MADSDLEFLMNFGRAPETTLAAAVVTAAAVGNTVLITPEDVLLGIGQLDEIALWLAAGHLIGNAAQGVHLDEAIKNLA